MDRKLTVRQQRFVEEYMVDFNATQAAIRAGYSEKTAYRTGADNLKLPQIASALEAYRNKMSEKTGITVEYVLTNLQTVAERCMQAEEITDRDGNGTGEYKFDSSGANRALELLGKHLGMFKDRVELEVVGGIAEQLKAAREARTNGAK